jgi:hypothetical protein
MRLIKEYEANEGNGRDRYVSIDYTHADITIRPSSVEGEWLVMVNAFVYAEVKTYEDARTLVDGWWKAYREEQQTQ